MTYQFVHSTLRLAKRARHLVAFSLLLSFSGFVSAASLVPAETGGKPVAEYLPTGVNYDPAIPTPEQILGAEVGEWHVRHDQLVTYMRALANASDRITIEETGRTHENRPLLLLTITAPDNQSRIDTIRKNHLDAWKSGNSPKEGDPLVFYMGYSIHGNEPSGSNAAMVIGYYLAAAQSEDVDQLLRNNVNSVCRYLPGCWRNTRMFAASTANERKGAKWTSSIRRSASACITVVF